MNIEFYGHCTHIWVGVEFIQVVVHQSLHVIVSFTNFADVSYPNQSAKFFDAHFVDKNLSQDVGKVVLVENQVFVRLGGNLEVWVFGKRHFMKATPPDNV